MTIRPTAIKNKLSLSSLAFLVFVLSSAYLYASDYAGYADILDKSERDTKKQTLIIPGQSVGFLIVGKPIPHSFIEFYGPPDSYAKPSETMDSGSLYWENKLLIKLNDRKDKRNIFSVYVEDPIFKTAKRIGVGSKFRTVKEAYPKGKEYINEFRGQTAWEVEGIIFFIADGKVSEIFISKHLHSYE